MSLPFHKSLIKHLAATIILCTPFIAAKCQAGTITEHYVLTQKQIRTVIAPSSGLEKASCVFLNRDGDQVIGQNVTVLTELKEQGLLVVELQADYTHHNEIVAVKCK